MNFSDILTDKPEKVLSTCFHCGEQVPDNTNWTVFIQGKHQSMCCPGCQAVASTIVDYGLDEFYRNRDSYQQKANESNIEIYNGKFITYDNISLQKEFVEQLDDNLRKITLILEGVVCPACIWLNESTLQKLDGIESVLGNYTTGRIIIRWDESKLKLSKILEAISSLGYTAYPFNSTTSREVYENERNTMLKRIGIAGLFGMQVMMITIAFYVTGTDSIQSETRTFFYWLCLFLTLPVILYSGKPFFSAAIRDIRYLRPGMDIPVALGISIAFIGSIYNTLSGHGHVYYDSVVMFIFFLLTGRYFEFMSRNHTVQYLDKLNKIIPATTTLITGGNSEELIPVADLKLDDVVLVKPGESFPADGLIVEGNTSIDESIITGESIPVIKKFNESIIAGSINNDSPVKIKVTALGNDTVYSRLCRLANENQYQKPSITLLTDKISGWFVLSILFIAGIVSWYWWHVDSSRWLPITISVLVVTCPCALSLATPTAITAATGVLMKYGIAIKSSDCIEKIVKVTDFIFDKTGTLTHGKPQIIKVNCEDFQNREKYHAIAAAMERSSEHLLAKTIADSYWGINMPVCKKIENKSGYGVSAEIDNTRYYIGSARFIGEQTRVLTGFDTSRFDGNEMASLVLLATNDKLLCTFLLEDMPRDDAKELIEYLHGLRINTTILSGDRTEAVNHIASILGIENVYSSLDPVEKLDVLNKFKADGAVTAVVGDGINDAPILAGAHVSIAMGSGTDLARLNADMILLNGMLGSVVKAVDISFKAFRTIRQNITWAIAYNVIALPLAITGMLEPWMAALGMSMSSLVVVGNATRLGRE